MLAGEEFYGLVYTKGESNFASFYEASKDRSLFDDELSFEAMDKESVREALIRLYPRGYFYVIKESSDDHKYYDPTYYRIHINLSLLPIISLLSSILAHRLQNRKRMLDFL